MVSILIVDNSAIDRQLMDGLLSKESDFDVWTAKNAEHALDQMRQGMIDILVTDLQMPDADGLSLVRSIHESYGDTPSILVTAPGTEEIASSVLQEGAAGYVCKTEIAQKLVETIRNVWLLMQSERSYERLAQLTLKTEYKFELDNDVSLIPAVVDLAQQTMKGIADCTSLERLRIAVCLEQALLNAAYHGNLEIGKSFMVPSGDDPPDAGLKQLLTERSYDRRYNNRKIRTLVQIKRRRISFIIRDEGPGFDHSKQGAISEGGRGLNLMRHFMDEVKFNEKGNEVTMIRYLGVKSNDTDSHLPILKEEPQPTNYGKLVSEQSGREIDLSDRRMLVGRRKSCHVVIPHSDVSSHHCQLFIEEGWWCIKDLQSANGTKINGKKISKGVLSPDDILSFGRHEYKIIYSPTKLGAVGPTRPTLT